MIVQVVHGNISDSAAAAKAIAMWQTDVAPGAAGWLGTTIGVTDDGEYIGLHRFESEEDLQKNNARPEQAAWDRAIAVAFPEGIKFRTSKDVILDLVGNPDDAGFVQIMCGRVTDSERARELMSENPGSWASFRPDIIGTMTCLHDDGEYTMAVYFTSEEAARAGEANEPPPELQAQMKEMDELSEGETTFMDIKTPLLASP